MTPVFLRFDDFKTRSRRKILLSALLFYAVTRLASMVALLFLVRLYFLYGMDAMAQLRFTGSIEGIAYAAMEHGVWPMALWLLLGAPLLEETAFRLGLSFRRSHAALGAGAFTLFLVSRFAGWWWAIIPAAAVAAAVRLLTTADFWRSRRERLLKPAVLLSTVLFGAAHLFAMEGLSLAVLPVALIICFMLFCAGATFAYLRLNMGFGWALAAHIINNLPSVAAVLMLLY